MIKRIQNQTLVSNPFRAQLHQEEREPVREKPETMDIISGFYSFTSSHESTPSTQQTSCPAVIMARHLIKRIEIDAPALTDDGSLPHSFYQRALPGIKGLGLFHEEWDEELVTIYLKQTAMILRTSGFIISDDNHAAAGRAGGDFYTELLQTFWNETLWSQIFPSDPEGASELWKNRSIFIDILGSSLNADLTHICNQFFELTGFARKGDMISISFIDFYLVTWLQNFGIVQVTDTGDENITVNLTETGQNILPHL